jgi:hypothetical protein
MEITDAAFDNSPLTRGIQRRWLEAQNQRPLMNLVVANPPTDRLANEQAPRMPKFVGGHVELVQRLRVNFEQYRDRI